MRLGCLWLIPGFGKNAPVIGNARSILFGLIGVAGIALAGPVEDFELGAKRYRDGDMMGAMAPLKTAADAGHAQAQALYGDILDKAEMDEDAIDYLTRAAAQGNADGQYGLAVMLLAGEGTERDPARAASLLRAAARQDARLAINALAQAYLRGDAELDAQDAASPEGRSLITRAAELGYLPAIDALADAFERGAYGLTPDPAQAARWRDRASEARRKLPADTAS
ncbi:tetratricopeptide repeat protein [Nitrogeniibacter aestuarii]|uniref:tetratricopeptide repeat protein n=1 Tax=Nitrogeniibacter aestuarii TaxID=2815343 RepID=UPI001D12C600|nr:tetratricopeptide repeat protein [Nitrogeniibacter aestuarii]